MSRQRQPLLSESLGPVDLRSTTSAASSTTGASGVCVPCDTIETSIAARDDAIDMLGAVPDVTRMKMELIARASASPDRALVPIVRLLVGDADPAKVDAIVAAFQTNPPLREQWQRTYQILRA